LKKILSVVGARPNFIKIAPLHKVFTKYNTQVNHLVCHTGQHFDEQMSKVFFDELELPAPDFYLGVGGGSHASQTARIMIEFEKILLSEKPDLIIVPGDVNSTMACSLVASKMKVPIAHIESGLRSFDREMPEEINRIVTDILADFLFVSEPSGIKNLKKEGIPDNKIFFVGNIMIDSLLYYLPRIKKSEIIKEKKLKNGEYALVTFHRPGNVDTSEGLKRLVKFLNTLADKIQIVFPIHPRTRLNLDTFGLFKYFNTEIILSEPIGYIDFLALTQNAKIVITDSGGIQEETTWLGIPCITVRNNTERPVTVTEGTNYLAGTDFQKVLEIVDNILEGNAKKGKIPQLWDGKTALRISQILINKI
jgi:UDP-N-acetylglucosamine 2-epimerase (non-hydrolysing)